MKFILLLLLFFVSAYADVYTQKLYEKILGSIFQERPIVVFASGEAKTTLQKSKMFYVVDSCQESNVAVVNKDFSLKQDCSAIPIFTTTYRSYISIKDAFGAFYWRKGRPQIHFNKRGLNMFHLHLPYDLQRFIDEK